MIVSLGNPKYVVRILSKKASKADTTEYANQIMSTMVSGTPFTAADPFDISKDVVAIQVNSTCREMVNNWSVTLSPRDDKDGDSYYDKIEPMDYCEILVKRYTNKFTTLIRGFVTNITKQVDFSQGQPKRIIMLQGENYGKIMRQSQVHYMLGLPTNMPTPGQAQNANLAAGTALMTDMPLLFGSGVEILKTQGCDKIVEMLFNRLIKPNFLLLQNVILDRGGSNSANGNAQKIASGNIKDFELKIDSEGIEGLRNSGYYLTQVDPSASLLDMTVYEAIKSYAMLPFNEIFTQDDDDSTKLVFRPTPWRDRNGDWIGPTDFGSSQRYESTDALTGLSTYNTVRLAGGYQPIPISSEEIIGYTFSRSDQEVYNYYFVDSVTAWQGPSFEALARQRSLDGDSAVSYDARNINPHYTMGAVSITAPDGSPATTKESIKMEFSRMELFGFRKLHIPLKVVSAAFDSDRQKELESKGVKTDPSMWVVGDYLAGNLFHALEHNSALESGVVILKGREDIKPGNYMVFKHDRKDPEPYWHYITDVQHVIQPYDGVFYTQCQVIRGERHLHKTLAGK